MTSTERKNLRTAYYNSLDMQDAVASLIEELQGRYDAMTEGRQNSDRGERIAHEIDALEDLEDAIDTFLDAFNEADAELNFLV